LLFRSLAVADLKFAALIHHRAPKPVKRFLILTDYLKIQYIIMQIIL